MTVDQLLEHLRELQTQDLGELHVIVGTPGGRLHEISNIEPAVVCPFGPHYERPIIRVDVEEREALTTF